MGRALDWNRNTIGISLLMGLFIATAWGQSGAVDLRGTVRVEDTSRLPSLSRAVVFLESHPNLSPNPNPNDRPQIAQRDRAFVPDLLVVARGTTVEFPNGDPFSHNVFSKSRAAQFDLDRYPQGQSKSYTFDQVGLVQLFCNIHPEMRAVILVVPNRYFTRADNDGRFVIPAVPVGRYTLAAWHEQTGRQQQAIDVRTAGDSFTITLPQSAARKTVESRPRTTEGVEQGLGIKRERLNLPVVQGSHPAKTTGSP